MTIRFIVFLNKKGIELSKDNSEWIIFEREFEYMPDSDECLKIVYKTIPKRYVETYTITHDGSFFSLEKGDFICLKYKDHKEVHKVVKHDFIEHTIGVDNCDFEFEICGLVHIKDKRKVNKRKDYPVLEYATKDDLVDYKKYHSEQNERTFEE